MNKHRISWLHCTVPLLAGPVSASGLVALSTLTDRSALRQQIRALCAALVGLHPVFSVLTPLSTSPEKILPAEQWLPQFLESLQLTLQE